MQIQAKRSTFGDYGNVDRDQVINVDERKAMELIKSGVFRPYDDKAKEMQKAKQEARATLASASHGEQPVKLEDVEILRAHVRALQVENSSLAARVTNQGVELSRLQALESDLGSARATIAELKAKIKVAATSDEGSPEKKSGQKAKS